MPDVLSARCDALGAVWATWTATLRDLSAGDWGRPTRLGNWTIAELVAHHSLFPRGLTRLVTQRADGAPTVPSAVAMLRSFNRPGGLATTKADAVAGQARTVAEETRPEAFVERFERDGPAAVAALRDAGDVVIDYFGHGTMPLAEVLAIAVMEATVHLLDLQRALGADPAVPDAPLAETAALLAGVADPVTLVEAASGRTTTNPFPVIR
jgi:uncharacterized protein (TIGR03083 family)